MSAPPNSLPEAMNAAVTAVAEMGGWTRHADAKCGFVLGADIVLIGSISALGGRLHIPFQIGDWLICVATSIILLSIGFTVSALWPRTHHVAKTLFDWPVLAAQREPLAVPFATSALIDDLWSHALTLARINDAKYRALNRAIALALAGIACTTLWSITFAPIK